MTSQSGIAPSDNMPSGLGRITCRELADTAYDLERMLGVLRLLPGLHGLRPAAGDYLGPDAAPIEITLELELDGASPHVDLVGQLARHIERVVEQRGVVLGRTVLDRLERIAAHACRAWAARSSP